MKLREAFGMGKGDVVAIVGGGGKTTILYRLARETAAGGGRAIVTGTTRFTPPAEGETPPIVMEENPEDLLAGVRDALSRSPVVIAGPGWGNQDRIMPVEPALVERLAAIDGVTAVVAEADGSAGRPFKAPAEHEPVVAPATTLLLTVAGIDVLGRPLTGDWVHRPEIVAELSGEALGSPVTEETIAKVLADPRGGRKGLPPGARWLPVINKVDDDDRLVAARRIGRLLIKLGAERVILARAGHDPPVVEFLSRFPYN